MTSMPAPPLRPLDALSARAVGEVFDLYDPPLWLVTSAHAGARNVMAAAWASICCSRPPCLAVSLRAATSRPMIRGGTGEARESGNGPGPEPGQRPLSPFGLNARPAPAVR